LDVVRMDRNLMIGSHKVNFGKGGAVRKVVGLVLDVWDWVMVGVGASVQGSVISTRPPNPVLLGHEMESGRPWALGTSGCTVAQHSIALGLGHSQVIRSKAAWAAGYWWPWCCLNVVHGIVPHFMMDPSRFGQLQQFLQDAVWGRASCDGFHTGYRWMCDEAWHGQRCDPIEQAVVPAIDKSIMQQQVHTDDW
jgi:hypothetical protein